MWFQCDMAVREASQSQGHLEGVAERGSGTGQSSPSPPTLCC